MGRGKIEIKRIENTNNRQVTFSKRRVGLLKKAHELAVLTDARIGLIVFSASGKLYQYQSPGSSMEEIIDRFLKAENIQFENRNIHQQLHSEIAKIRNETDRLQLSLKQITGEDLTGLTVNDLNQLEEQLEFSVGKVRTRKNQLLNQQLENLHRKVMFEHHVMMEQQHEIEEQKEREIREMGFLEPFGQILDDSRSLLHLGPEIHPFQLQPIQPNLQEAELHGHRRKLW
ncbi:MADS-box transcription factor 31-like [Dendrobium catenatum]|uniref:MADS-box transcription factor 31-like n=1 Tax=Dendrobium catenatum TaxID=906689 RepID=UPI0010A0BC3F|nr:MADS-box transcription factor 31-like [Dendrobium catenatum]